MNMHLIDWSIVVGLLILLTFLAISTRRYSKSVSAFLAAERCGERYMISIANSMASMGVITMVFFFQVNYDTGFTGQWWPLVSAPVGIILALTGWVVFRFRQTRAMTLGQFFEIRYSKSFRIFAGFVAFCAGILNFGIFPSVGARFFISFCGFPDYFTIPGIEWQISSFVFIMVFLLAVSIYFTFQGGQVSIMATEFIQGIFTSLVFVVVLFIIFFTFTKNQMSETLLSAEPGRSLVNPFDIGKEENFNPAFYIMGMILGFYGVMSWQGTAGYNCSATSAHEAKMANMLAGWRVIGIVPLIYILIPVSTHIYLEHKDFAAKSVEVNAVIKVMVDKELEDLASASIDKNRAMDYKLLSSMTPEQSDNLLKLRDMEVEQIGSGVLAGTGLSDFKDAQQAKQLAELLRDKTDEIKSQTRFPLVIGQILPKGVMGLFCAALMAAFISTHATYLHSWGSMFIQDVVLPFRKKPLSAKSHIWLLRLAVIGVAVYIFMFSFYFRHSQRILMYCQITASIFVAGAGSLIVGGLYWKKGTAAGAWVALAASVVLSILGIFITQSGVSAVYAAQGQQSWMRFSEFLSGFGANGIFWKAAEALFKTNAQTIFFYNCFICMALYAVFSLITCKKNFDMDKMLHRGKYRVKGDELASITETQTQTIWQKLGFSQDFTKSDYFIAGITIVWPLLWFVVFIIGTVIQQKITDKGWFEYWYVWIWIMFVLGLAVTVWLTIGGFGNFADFFRRLKNINVNEKDDGMVVDRHNTDEEVS